MPFLRFLVALACAALLVSAWLLQTGPHNLYIDVCPYLQQASIDCPAWAAKRPVPDFMPVAFYLLAALGAVFVIWPLIAGMLDQPTSALFEQYIQRGRDLHERCRREGDAAVMPAIDEWRRDVSKFLRRLGHKYVIAFGDLKDIELFASQYDTAATLEIRQRLQRLTEFAARFREDGVEAS